jgi:NAD(P)-dependent dehydrogenase (short-subunit alcohol dehydrogenase family)
MMGRIALVTGANRGIGTEICRQLGQLGMTVILTARDSFKGEAAAERLRAQGLDIHFQHLDVREQANVEEARARVLRQFGRLDVLVNNAAILLDEGVRFLDISYELLQTTFIVNTFGPFLTCKAFIPTMRENCYGRIVNISSEYGQMAQQTSDTSAYKLSKLALNGMTRILAEELVGTNIKVNSMCPGWVRTEMGGPHADLSVEQGADTAVWLATLPDDGPSGGFFQRREPLAW